VENDQKKRVELLNKWMFCLNTMEVCLNSKYAEYIPEPLYVLINDARLEMEELLAYYEHESFETNQGRA
jgi:hypothetical protein